MNKIILSAGLLAMISVNVNAQKYYDKIKIDSKQDSLSYSIGLLVSQDLDKLPETLKINIDAYAKGIKDGLSKEGKTLWDVQAANEFLTLEQERATEIQKATALAAEKEFFETNGKRSGVKTTESGLQYEVIKQGNGHQVEENDTVWIHFEIALIDGTKCQSTFNEEEPIMMQVVSQHMLEGMKEGIELMNEGSEYKLYLPSEIAFGSYSPDETIPPYSPIVLDMIVVKAVEGVAAQEEKEEYLEEDDFSNSPDSEEE